MATEEQERRELFGSLKVKAYQNGREILFNQLLKQMAAAAEAVGKRSTTEASTVEATLAAQAWKLTSLIGVAEPLADGSPDWSGTSAQLLNWSTNQTIEFRGFFSLALASIGRTDFALVELETIPTNSLEGANALALHHGGRTILYSARGWDHLAAQEAAKFNGLVAKSSSPDDGKVLVAGMHAFLAYQAGKERDFQRLDAEIAQCVRIWPENPMLVYLTGEKLAENGEWEKAAESLEASVAGTKNEWLAKRLAERARELRDGKGNTKAFVMDASFLVPFVVQSLAIQAEDSAMGKKLTQYLEEAKSFGQGLSRQLFGKESDKPEEIQ
jgi:hypothetical protein